MRKIRKDNKGRVLRKGEIQRKKDLKYVYTYWDLLGNRKYIYDDDLTELRKREEKLRKDQLDGLDVYVAGKVALNTVVDIYLSTRTDLRSTTYSNYMYMYNHFVRNTFGKKKISDIKYSDVLQFYLYLLEKMNLKLNTLDNIHTILHPAFQLAVRDGIIRSNPSDNVIRQIKKTSGKNNGVRHALTSEQESIFIQYIRKNEVFYHWLCLFIFLLRTGCRISEAIGLRWEDIDFENRLISINHSVTYYPRKRDTNKCEFEVSLPKTESGVRTIPMLDEVYYVLKKEYEEQKKHGFCEVELDGMLGFVFKNRFGNLCNPKTVNDAIKRIVGNYNAEEMLKATRKKREAVLLPHFSCHHLRHTFCTRLCELDINIKVIQVVMGHANIQTTLDIYTEVTNKKKQDVFKAISDKLDISGKESCLLDLEEVQQIVQCTTNVQQFHKL